MGGIVLMSQKGHDLKENKKDKIYQAIKRKIIDTEYKPGDMLSDRKIADELHVSRTPVREALNLLQMDKYVIQEAGRGFFVKGLSLQDIENLYIVREALEVTALKQSAETHEPKALENIGLLLEKHGELIKDYKPKGKFLEDADFHRSLAAMSDNSFLLQILESIYERIEMLKNIESVQIDRVKIANEQHQMIYNTLAQGDFTKAGELLSRHIIDSKNDILKRIQKRFTILHF